jgi:hypothetical protein
MSLHAMLHKDMQNEVPDSVLNHCSESDKVLVENLLRLPGTGRIVGFKPCKHNNSYRRQSVVEVRIALQEGSMMLVFDVCDDRCQCAGE